MKTKKSPSVESGSSVKKSPILVRVDKLDASYARRPGLRHETGTGKYALLIDITATTDTLYIPSSVGTGRVSTGFVYQIEGSATGKGTAEISCRGEGVTTVTLGTIAYWKIPPGKTAHIKIYAQVTGSLNREYRVVVSRINYKLNPNDMRYTRLLVDIATKPLHFK